MNISNLFLFFSILNSKIYKANAQADINHISDDFNDTKSLLDRKVNPVIIDSIHSYMNNSTSNPIKMKMWVESKLKSSGYLEPGGDVFSQVPVDFSEDHRYIKNITNPELLNLLDALNQVWKQISKISNNSFSNATTLINTGLLFFVPGGRFREFYYWDSYWILKGLLGARMEVSAKILVLNFIKMIGMFGFIPNGSRTYYLGRSQPPFFAQMIYLLYKYDSDKFGDFVLNEALDAAIIEYHWQQKNRQIKIVKDGAEYFLNRYYDNLKIPRLESFREDLDIFNEYLEFNPDSSADAEVDKKLFTHIRAAAESGWDFSSRWLADGLNLRSIHTADFIPVDLNAILYSNEKIISKLLKIKGETKLSEKFTRLAKKRRHAIQKLLWNDDMGVWTDYDFIKQKMNDSRFYFSNIMPLIFGIHPRIGTYKDILLRYSKTLFGYPGGIPASSEETTISSIHQWDFPNVWAPLPNLMVDFLLKMKENKIALHVAKTFFWAVNIGFKEYGVFFEKYLCTIPGKTGYGGEYVPQIGFGWTNGTIIDFIVLFGDEIANVFEHEKSYLSILEYLKKTQ